MTDRLPRLIVFAGLPATGKSTLAEGVAGRMNAVWLRVDTIEAALLKAGLPASFETGWAAYLVAHDLGAAHLRLHQDVVIDAVNGVEPARALWEALARRTSARRFVIEVVCSDAREHRRRVESRPDPSPPMRAPTWEEVVRREYRPWMEPILRVDGTLPAEPNVSRIVQYCVLA